MRSVQASEPVYYVETGNFAKKQCKMKIGRYYISESVKEMYGDREEAGNCFFFWFDIFSYLVTVCYVST